MDKEEYYKRIERINNRFKTDRVSADEEYQLVCQKNYLSTKYIERLEQQCKKQKEVCNRLESNWNKLKEWVNKQYDYYISEEDYIDGRLCFTDMKDKMQEIEKRK